MPLDSKTIETLAVNAVKDSIITTDFLEQYIAENDKEPSWDGFVYIYGNKKKTKDTLEGRMAVQIKGKECDNHSKKEISYSMPKADLVNYLNDGGCILFVVYIGNSGLTKKIYYSILTPIKLRKLLVGINKTKAIHLKEFPSDKNQKATILLNSFQNCQKQASFTKGKLYSIEELKKKGVLENIEIPISGVGINDPQNALINNEVYLYAKIKGSDIPQPLDFIPQNIHTQQIIEANITINDKVFYSTYKIIKSADETCLCVGESLKIYFYKEKIPAKLKYKNSEKVRILANDLDFILSYINAGYFKIGDVSLPFDYTGMDKTKFNKEFECNRLLKAKEIVEMLDLLGCEEDINLNELNAKDLNNLNCLVKSFVKNEPIYAQNNKLSPVICIKVGPLSFAVIAVKENKDKSYRLLNFFSNSIHVAVENPNNKEEMIPISQYCILHKEELLTLNNLNFSVLLSSFKSIDNNAITYESANYFLLDLIKACDESNGEKKEKFLNICLEFSHWLEQVPDKDLDKNIKKLNSLQVIKRKRDFDKNEVRMLYSMAEDSTISEDCRVGAYLLLDQQNAAEIHFEKLSKDQQENFKTYPIYYFWNNGNK